jgi:hypothetical protein
MPFWIQQDHEINLSKLLVAIILEILGVCGVM